MNRPPGPESREPLLARTVSTEALLLALICLADLVLTLYWVSHGEAREGNAWMAGFLRGGAAPFIAAKLCLFVPAIVAGEWYRPRSPRLILGVMRLVIAAYVAVYLLHSGPAVVQRLLSAV